MKTVICRSWTLCLFAAIAGCVDSTPVAEPEKPTQQPAPIAKPEISPPVEKAEAASEQPAQPTPEELAREKLKAGLDAWSFGDSHKKFEETNPGIKFTDFDWILLEALLRYEIGQSRTREVTTKDGKTFQEVEFVVTLTQTTKGGREVVKNKNFTVHPPGYAGQPTWTVLGLGQ